jgi:hypothetical protein
VLAAAFVLVFGWAGAASANPSVGKAEAYETLTARIAAHSRDYCRILDAAKDARSKAIEADPAATMRAKDSPEVVDVAGDLLSAFDGYDDDTLASIGGVALCDGRVRSALITAGWAAYELNAWSPACTPAAALLPRAVDQAERVVSSGRSADATWLLFFATTEAFRCPHALGDPERNRGLAVAATQEIVAGLPDSGDEGAKLDLALSRVLDLAPDAGDEDVMALSAMADALLAKPVLERIQHDDAYSRLVGLGAQRVQGFGLREMGLLHWANLLVDESRQPSVLDVLAAERHLRAAVQIARTPVIRAQMRNRLVQLYHLDVAAALGDVVERLDKIDAELRGIRADDPSQSAVVDAALLDVLRARLDSISSAGGQTPIDTVQAMLRSLDDADFALPVDLVVMRLELADRAERRDGPTAFRAFGDLRDRGLLPVACETDFFEVVSRHLSPTAHSHMIEAVDRAKRQICGASESESTGPTQSSARGGE